MQEAKAMMRSRRLTSLLVAMVSAIAMSGPALAASYPDTKDSGWEVDPVFDGQPSYSKLRTAQPGDYVPGFWYRDTTNQNALTEHTWQRYQTYSVAPRQPLPKVWQLGGLAGSAGNVLIVETTDFVAVIGTGGNPQTAAAVKNFIATNIRKAPDENGYRAPKPIRWLIIPDADQSMWGGATSLVSPTPENPVTVITSLDLGPVLQQRQALGSDDPTTEAGSRLAEIDGVGLPTGPDGVLGPPNWKGRASGDPLLCPPYATAVPNVQCVSLSNNSTTLDLQDVKATFVRGFYPTPLALSGLAETAAISVYFPQLRLLVTPSLFGLHLPDTAPLASPTIPLQNAMNTIKGLLDMQPAHAPYYPGWVYLAPMTQPVMGPAPDGRVRGQIWLTVQYDVLSYINDYVLEGLRNRVPVDDLVASARIPDDLMAACGQFLNTCDGFVNSLGNVVRGAYQSYIGWFDGDVRSLSTSLTKSDKDQVLIDVAGGQEALLTLAKKAELKAQTIVAVEKALELTRPLITVPREPYYTEAKAVYKELLTKAGYMQKSANLRNYYLSEAAAY